MKIFPQRKSIRFKNYDYSSGGFYFITICTQNRLSLFGKIVGADQCVHPHIKMNNAGKMVNQWWTKIPQRFGNIELDEYQIMPNHIHGIIVIRDGRTRTAGIQSVGVGFPDPLNRKCGRGNRAPTLGQMIAYFKYQSTKQINNHFVRAGIIPPHTIKKIWQRNYYEHVIRTENDLNKIRKYIKNNPQMWHRDRNNPKNWKEI